MELHSLDNRHRGRETLTIELDDANRFTLRGTTIEATEGWADDTLVIGAENDGFVGKLTDSRGRAGLVRLTRPR